LPECPGFTDPSDSDSRNSKTSLIEEGFSVFPNPFYQFATVQVQVSEVVDECKLLIYNQLGQIVEEISIVSGNKRVSTVQVGSEYEKGVYIISLKKEGQIIQTQKFIKL